VEIRYKFIQAIPKDGLLKLGLEKTRVLLFRDYAVENSFDFDSTYQIKHQVIKNTDGTISELIYISLPYHSQLSKKYNLKAIYVHDTRIVEK
jgi:hypothetical protein